jgi:hypothetical protein
MRLTFPLIPRAAAAALLLSGAGFAQNQSTPHFTRDICIKAADGKHTELRTFLHDVTAKIMRARVDEGLNTWGVIAEVVEPTGTTARCDYHLFYGNDGKLPDPRSSSNTEAIMQRAGLDMKVADIVAKRNAVSRLVSIEVYREVETVPMTVAGSYIRLNHYKVRNGQSNASWIEIERNTWKPLVVADNADGHKSGWVANLMMMPQGQMVWSNALTVDIFPDWDALMRGIPVGQLWPKVHANRSIAEWSDRLSTIVERQLVEVAHVETIARPKSASAAGGTQ